MIKKIVIFEDADNGTDVEEKIDVIESMRLAAKEIWGKGQKESYIFPKIELFLYDSHYILEENIPFDGQKPVSKTQLSKDIELIDFYRKEFQKQFEMEESSVIFVVDYIILSGANEDDTFSKEVVDKVINFKNDESKSKYYCVLYTSQRWKDMKDWISKQNDNPINNLRFLAYATGDFLSTQYDFENVFSALDAENDKTEI